MPALTKQIVTKGPLFFCSALIFIGCKLTQAQPATPKFPTFQSISTERSSQIGKSPFPGQAKSIIANDLYAEQNHKIQQRSGMTVPGPTAVPPSQASEDDAIE